jgi:hypothetical protein
MAFTSTQNVKTYAQNLEILGDKPGNLGQLFDELRAGAANYDVVTGTSQQAVVNASYIPNNASLVIITLPATAAVGQRLSVVGNGAGGWRIAQNAGQTINKSGTATTAGTGGSLSSANRYDTAHLVCTVANTTWVFSSGQGAHVLA